MYYIGLHMSGACRLPWPWNGCKDPSEEYCVGTDGEPKRPLGEVPFHFEHRFDEMVLDSDTYVVNKAFEAVLYHYMVYRYYHVASNETRLDVPNDYTRYYFPRVLEELKRRQLDLLVILPEHSPSEMTADVSWLVYEMVYAARMQHSDEKTGFLGKRR
jgi:hypothetical protein